ncbi:phosphatase PAP2 family protein [Actinosynnema pretiosum]|uniref:phosphatase PAP2 family protein n=1 Tax=Actinosynnema pretiosum TaxID=42197 RepID=UPI0020A5FB88|nr:phosphatase PAP2 family protein [Actinosynnema pretiosum]
MPLVWGGGHLLGWAVVAPWDVGLSGRICSTRAGDAALDVLFRVISALGNPAPVTGLAVLSCCCALLLGRLSAGLVLLVVPWLASLACGALKDVVARPRPGFGCVAAAQTGFSFPSAHAVGATTGLLLVALVLPAVVLPAPCPVVTCLAVVPTVATRPTAFRPAAAHLVAERFAGAPCVGARLCGAGCSGARCGGAGCGGAGCAVVRRTALLCALVLAEAVSFSRVALGAHYLTDVLAGQAFGALWAWVGVRALLVTGAGSRAPTRRRT